MEIINKIRKEYEKKYISELSDRRLLEKYDYMKEEIKISREIRGFASSRDIEYKNQLLKEIKKRGLSYE